MEIFGFAITFLSIVIAIQTWMNGRWMRKMLGTIHQEGEERHREVVKLFEKMDETLRAIHRESERSHREVVKLLKRMDERTAKIAELIYRVSKITRGLRL